MKKRTTWVTAANVDEIAAVLEGLENELDELLALADEYPVELHVAGRWFVFDDEQSLKAVIAKIRADVEAFRNAA